MSAVTANLDFERPATLDALMSLLAHLSAQGKSYALAAGATDLMPQIKHGVVVPQVVVSLNALSELAGIEVREEGGLSIGALTRLADMANDPRVLGCYPALAEAALRVASPPIRQRATLGGNLLVDNRCIYINQGALNRATHAACFKAGGDACHLVKSAELGKLPQCQARFVSDTAPVLLILGASLTLVSPAGMRQVLLSDFYRDDGMDRHALAVDEVLVAIELPPTDGMCLNYDKLAIRRTPDFATLGVALGVRRDGRGQVQEFAVALTGIGTHPGSWRHAASDHAGVGAMLQQACSAANGFTATYQQDFFPRDYRQRMIEVMIRRGAARLGSDTWT